MGWIADLFKEIPLSVNLQSKIEEFEKKYAILETENKEFKSKFDEANKEIDRLNQIIKSLTQEKDTSDKINDIGKQILKCLFETNQEFYASDIARQFNISIGIAEYHIDNLLKLELIHGSYNMMEDPRYYISPDGRAYIVENSLT